MESPELNKCGISAEEYESRLVVIENIIGTIFTKKIRDRRTTSVWDIVLVQNRASLLERLKSVNGFEKVKRMLKQEKGTLESPLGYWFQLSLGSILMQKDESVEFEQKFGENLVDVSLRNGSVCIECKVFVGNSTLTSASKVFFSSGTTSNDEGSKRFEIHLVHPNVLLENASHLSEPLTNTTWIISTFIPWVGKVEIDESKRFREVLDGKMRQLVAGACNIKALDITALNLNPERLRNAIESIFEEEPQRYTKVSGVLLVKRLGLDDEVARLKGKLKYQFALIINKHADVPIDTDLKAKFSF